MPNLASFSKSQVTILPGHLQPSTAPTMLSQAVFLIDIVCGTRAPSSVDSDQRKDELQYFDERRMRASATFTSCAVCAYLFKHSTTSCPSHPRAPCEPRSMAIFQSVSSAFLNYTSNIATVGGPRRWRGVAGNHYLSEINIYSDSAGQAVRLFFLGFLTEYWNRPSASRW